MRRAKIIATLGPASCSDETIEELIKAGANVFRLNLAHGTPETHHQTADRVRGVASKVSSKIGILADLPGTKMRTGILDGGEAYLGTGSQFVLFNKARKGDATGVSTTVLLLEKLVQIGDEVFLADGEITLRVLSVINKNVVTEVVQGGILRSNKGMFLPAAEKRVRAFTNADQNSLKLALDLKADMVGLSFVRDAKDLEKIREFLPKRGELPRLIAKIETRSAVENLAEIVEAADGIMIARGDLGIQTSIQRLPILQKEIIQLCNERGKTVITATQMLESMCKSPRPTRAEVADIANAVFDGADALMLSEETAIGEFPIEAVTTMAEVIKSSETYPVRLVARRYPQNLHEDQTSWALAHAAVNASEYLGVKAILCPTRTGATAQRVAAFRPKIPILAFSINPNTLGSLTLDWGVVPLEMPVTPSVIEEVKSIMRITKQLGYAKSGDEVAIIAGTTKKTGGTDYVRILPV
jgi:pyruvate kinase